MKTTNIELTKQWKRRVTIALFNSSITSTPSHTRAPHCGR